MEAKTIEDRAKTSNLNWLKSDECEYGYDGYHVGYIHGATDQRKIDIDKACEWIKNNMAHFWHSDEDGIVSNFRKAMEE